MNFIEIAGEKIGDGYPTYILAEAGCNHNQSLDIAYKLIDSASIAGANAIKFQTYIADKIYSKKTPMMKHFAEHMNAPQDATMYDLIKKTELPYEMHKPIVSYCRTKKIPFLSTPFDLESVDFLDQFDVPAYKIASFEMTHFPLIKKVAHKRKPIILSTGMSSLGDIEKVLSIIHKEGNELIILLHCVSSYPARSEDYNLRTIKTLKDAFGYPVGVSDHTPGIDVAMIASALGANLIEKHITMDQNLPGPDHYFSLTPDQLKNLISGVQKVEAMLGSPHKKCTVAEEAMKNIGRRSLIAACDIPEGTAISSKHIEVKRPGSGIHPEFTDIIIGSIVVMDIKQDEPLRWEMFVNYKDKNKRTNY